MRLSATIARALGPVLKRAAGWYSRSTGLTWPTANSPWNFWQIVAENNQPDYRKFGPVYACWSIIAQEVSRVPLYHVRELADGSRERIFNRAPARIFRSPNQYQTVSDFLLYMTQALLQEGNAYALSVENDRFEPASLYPVNPRSVLPFVDPVDGDYYYNVTDTETLNLTGDPDVGYWVPARRMLHIRLFTLDHPLIGVSPLVAAAFSTSTGLSIGAHLSSFFANMGRPSGILAHPKKLEPAAIMRLKERFVEASAQAKSGAPVVLTEGMEWKPMTMSAVDAEIIATAKLTTSEIAQIYRVPDFLLNQMEEAKFSSVENLMGFFVNSGLGFYLNHIAQALTKFFRLDRSPNEYIEFDYETALLRGDFKSRMEALKEGIQGGVYSVNEARRRENLPPVEHGNEIRMQQQMVPLSFGAAPPQQALSREERITLLQEKLRRKAA